MSDQVLVKREGDILTITLNRPEKRNALTDQMLQRLESAADTLCADRTIRVAVLGGEGPAFCSGLDLRELAAAASASERHPNIETVLAALEAVPQPTLAMVRGDALAGGCELALHCDLRIATDTARLGMPLARIGLAVPYALTRKLIETIGVAATKELLFTGEPVDARRACALGLVNRVVPGPALHDATYAIARAIAANAPLAVRLMKRMVRRGAEGGSASDLEAEAAALRRSADLGEGLKAMLEKRPPVFRGE